MFYACGGGSASPAEKAEDDIVKLLLREDAGERVAGKTCPVELGRRVS